MEKWIVDRIEENKIIVEKDRTVTSIKREKIKFNVKEGDILIKNRDGKFILDKFENCKRKDYIEKLTEGLWEN